MMKRYLIYSLCGWSLCLLCASCEEDGPGPVPVPKMPYNAGWESLEVDSDAGEVSVEPFYAAMGEKMPIVFIRENELLSEGCFQMFENHTHDWSFGLKGLDVVSYCSELGYDQYPDSPDFFVVYEWVEVASFLPTPGSSSKVVVRYDENTSSEPREMFIHFYNGKWGFVNVRQAAAKEQQS
jgi:hypothetical protein